MGFVVLAFLGTLVFAAFVLDKVFEHKRQQMLLAMKEKQK